MNEIPNLIGFSEAKSGDLSFQTFNPFLNKNNKELYKVATRDEIEKSLELAEEAFYKSHLYSKNKAEFLSQISIELNKSKALIKIAYINESGLSKNRFETEFNRTIDTIFKFKNLIKNDNWKNIYKSKKSIPSLTKERIAVGTVLVFGASNFPLAYSTAGGDTISALACGCSVIVKSHPFHAGTSYLVAQAIVKAARISNMPEGIFSHIQDDTHNAAQLLILDERIKSIAFTGSIEGGRAIHDLTYNRKTPIPVFAEMGSSNPLVILPGKLKSNKNELIKDIATSVCNDAGQFCTKPGLIFYPNNQNGNDFKEGLIDQICKTQPNYMLHPSILKKFEELKIKKQKISKQNIIQRTNDIKPMQAAQSVLCIDHLTFQSHPELQEEVFGPFCILIKYEEINDLIKSIKQLLGQLTFSLFANESELSMHQEIIHLARIKAGRIIINGLPTGVSTSKEMHHGGPYPASTDSRYTSVGTDSILRFTRPIVYQK